MKIGVITPTRGIRPAFLERCKFYVDRQTLKSTHLIVDYPQKRFPHDLTDRYRFGLEKLKSECDLIFFMEDDDYYPPNYLEEMVQAWEECDRPELFGIGETFFYHPELQSIWYKRHEDDGPCAFQMCIRSDAVEKIDWSLVGPLFTDAGLWRQKHIDGQTVIFGKPLSIGIKHGRGLCGAGGHNAWFYKDRESRAQSVNPNFPNGPDEWVRYDVGGLWLRNAIGDDAEWYEQFAKNRGIV